MMMADDSISLKEAGYVTITDDRTTHRTAYKEEANNKNNPKHNFNSEIIVKLERTLSKIRTKQT